MERKPFVCVARSAQYAQFAQYAHYVHYVHYEHTPRLPLPRLSDHIQRGVRDATQISASP